MKSALITGITGQDGSYLTELLVEKGYMVYGLVRRSSLFNRSRIDHVLAEYPNQIKLVYGDLSDSSSLNRLLENTHQMKSIIWEHKAMWVFPSKFQNTPVM